MADATYQPSIYRKQGGAELVIASGGTVNVESGATFEVDGTQLSKLADLSTGLSFTASTNQLTSEVDSAVNAVNAKVNAILVQLYSLTFTTTG